MNCFKENTGPVEFGLRATEREMKLESTERRTNMIGFGPFVGFADSSKNEHDHLYPLYSKDCHVSVMEHYLF